MEKIPVIAVVGPTASGKTALAVNLAKALDGEIISADSMQIYKGMDIATAKPSKEEMGGIPHHLIDFLEPTEEYSVKRFCEDAEKTARDIHARQKRVIVAGGTGLYVDALLGNLTFEEEPDNTLVRAELQERVRTQGIDALLSELREIDPEILDSIDTKNEKRVLRALEIFLLTGEKPSLRRKRALTNESPFSPSYLCISFQDREKLYERINLRVETMLQNGLLEEAKRFYQSGVSKTAVAAIGYKELKPFLDGEISLEEATENLKTATRHYAKRQLTWFKRNEKINYLFRDGLSDEALLETALKILAVG